MNARERAVAIVVEWQDAVPGKPRPPGRTLAELIVKAISDSVVDEREACAKVCDSAAAERDAQSEDLIRRGEARRGDPRHAWLYCKRSEAQRCADKIRSR